MKLVSTPRVDFLRTLAAEILHNYGLGRTIIAVDGADAPARLDFATDLAEVLRETEHHVFQASLKYFQHSRTELQPFGPDSPERHYRYGFDYSALRRVLVEPFRMGGSTGFVTEEFDPDRDAWIEPTWQTAPADAILIVDGPFANRPELTGLWLYSIFLEGQPGQPGEPADLLYRADVNPREQASTIVDNSAPGAPRRVFLDRC